jgi:hypothetical protein
MDPGPLHQILVLSLRSLGPSSHTVVICVGPGIAVTVLVTVCRVMLTELGETSNLRPVGHYVMRGTLRDLPAIGGVSVNVA